MKSAKKPVTPAPTAPWENPLIPTKRLRELYTAMVELRLLEEHVAKLQSRKKSASPSLSSSGEEACRVSTALSLLTGDVTSDRIPGVATRFLRGAKLADLIPDAGGSVKASASELPFALDSERRLLLAIGAALALATGKKGSLALAYIASDDLPPAEWKPIFRLAATHTAPLIFVALPSPAPATKPGKLSELSTSAGVPGIPVDAADAVAVYRVVQESMLRARAGGGPVLMECIPFQPAGRKSLPSDPVRNMRDSLLHRKIADDEWFQSIDTRFLARLQAAGL